MFMMECWGEGRSVCEDRTERYGECVWSAMPVGMEEEVMSGEEGQRGHLSGEVKICVSVVGSKMWRCVEKCERESQT